MRVDCGAPLSVAGQVVLPLVSQATLRTNMLSISRGMIFDTVPFVTPFVRKMFIATKARIGISQDGCVSICMPRISLFQVRDPSVRHDFKVVDELCMLFSHGSGHVSIETLYRERYVIT